jgi:4a-hydroxytetrahydrobiopterin dehydratase
MEPLTDEQIDARLADDLSGWSHARGELVRDIELANFVEAIALVNAVAAVAEECNHHPDILVHGWKHLRLTLSTHSVGGLTAADLALAGRLDALLR